MYVRDLDDAWSFIQSEVNRLISEKTDAEDRATDAEKAADAALGVIKEQDERIGELERELAQIKDMP